MTIDKVLEKFALFREGQANITPIDHGLINHTWKIDLNSKSYIFQRVNSTVFKKPEDIAHNIEAIAAYLNKNYPEYFFVKPVSDSTGKTLLHDEGLGYFRAFQYVNNSKSKTVVKTADEAFEAARQFARFTAVLSGFDTSTLHTTIPDFHNLRLRYDQFMEAISRADAERRTVAEMHIEELSAYAYIAEQYEAILHNPSFKLRVTHHDTKISNVLFDGNNKGLCVIDLDTVMPGLFISDVGDMMRTYLSPANEEETDFDKVLVRADIYEAIVDGYMHEMGSELTAEEKDAFFYAGSFMIYMQALRFLTDYLNGDIYYRPDYPLHNLNRAKNQIVLLQRFMEMGETLSQIAKQGRPYQNNY